MENRTKHFLLKPALLAASLLGATLLSANLQAQENGPVQVIEPEIDRREIKTPEIDTENFEIGAYYGIISIEDFDSNEVLVVRATYHITEDFFFDLSYGESEGDKTSFEQLSGGSPLLSNEDREYSYYDLSLGWNVLPGEIFIGDRWAFNSALYLVAGIGSTEFAGDDWFTMTFGAGFKLLMTDWISWHIDVRDHIFDRDTFGTEETTNNIEFTTGFTVFF